MPVEKHVQKSKKGFLALDLDGMTMVQKIDQNFFYGWNNPESHLRQSLIEYIRAAQHQGYDIYILTARPSAIEPILRRLKLGTKPTGEIVTILEGYNIHIKSIERTSRRLKGNKMAEILRNYREGGAPNAEGILFDDQLIQINSVKAKEDSQLFAFDINSKKDLEVYVKHVPLPDGVENPFHPVNIIKQVLEPNIELITHGYRVTEESKKLKALKEDLDYINRESYPKEVELIEEIIDDLCVRLYEAQHRHYQPEITWVGNVTYHLQFLVDKLRVIPIQLTYDDIRTVCVSTLGKSSLIKAHPNTHSSALIKELLEHMQRIPDENGIKQSSADSLGPNGCEGEFDGGNKECKPVLPSRDR